MLSKFFKKFRTNKSKNKSFSLLSKSWKRKTKRTCIKMKVLNVSDKSNKVLDNNSNNSFKKIIKFLSPKTNNQINKEEEEVQVKHAKHSQDSGWVEMTRSFSQSSLPTIHGNFSTSSPVFSRKQFDNFSINCSVINSQETGINLNFDEQDSTIVKQEADMLRANSDSELLPLMEAKDNSDLEEEFTCNNNVFSQSFPTTYNSTRKESNNKLIKCIVGMRFAYEFSEKFAEESLICVDQNLFAGFDQPLAPKAEDQKNSMHDTLVEIPTRRQSFSDNVSNSSKVKTSSISGDCSNDNVNISLPKPDNYECEKKFDLLKISEGVETF